MKKFDFKKPLFESPVPPTDINVLWVDVTEKSGKLASIKEFNKHTRQWEPLLSGEGGGSTTSVPEYMFVKMQYKYDGVTFDDAVTLQSAIPEGKSFITIEEFMRKLGPYLGLITSDQPQYTGENTYRGVYGYPGSGHYFTASSYPLTGYVMERMSYEHPCIVPIVKHPNAFAILNQYIGEGNYEVYENAESMESLKTYLHLNDMN